MSKPYYRIGIDLDGVLCDFVHGFADLLCHIEAIPLPENFAPKNWLWYPELGVSKETVKKAWEQIESFPLFWGNLDPLPTAQNDLNALGKLEQAGHDLYFITNRPHFRAKFYSEEWLKRFGIEHPTVLIVGEKGPAAKALQLDLFIDDKVENCYNVLHHRGVKTRVYLFEQSYNAEFKDIYVHKVPSIQAMLGHNSINV